ncbi:MAG TPA: SDR family NAD(P)-dependent oxidoreductase [Candidatus Caccopulliclostridium gallistercoris]|uniref:SDR family NAD(P)-dependent oxidoreductase n=1 Tax=Candidatus Caccopulliclostridium gallistercoris TaxID=2840719 RepID=A0A9D1SYC8_9FIRM|nr:SDR family NAD(P)-dependent oxidoreductase [Candidatus Caccopulliclostridium gallistercoris]
MNIVITGASSGIGKNLAENFRAAGHNVIGLSRNVASSSDIACDVSNIESIESAFQEISKRFERIDLLINNAGFGISGATELISNEDAHKIFETNFFGVLNCSRYALPLMKNGARIVNISSVCAMFPLPFRALYSASKASVNLLSSSMRMELAPAGIDITCICPGDTKTNFTKNREKNFATNERYENRIENATKRIDKNENKRMSANKVSKKIEKICLKRKTKPIYIIGAKYKFLNFLTKIFPFSLLVKATGKLYGGRK